jgi:type VI secretion system secreted protein VgrG
MSENVSFAGSKATVSEGTVWTQNRRLLQIETSLGEDKLLLTSLTGQEAISELFSYEVDMLSIDHAILAESLIGDKVKLVITTEDDKTRPIHATVAQWRTGPLVGRELRQYRARLVPWLWYLGHSTDCRIFQNLNVPDIVEQVFATFGCSDYQMLVSRGDYPKLEFCVQYRESALNFVSRLMEEAGMFYFFCHEEDRHVMVIADKNVSFKALLDPQLIYAPGTIQSGLATRQSGDVTRWEHAYDFRPGRWAQRDFNFETPSTDLTTNEKTVLKLRNAPTFERYDYPGRYVRKGLGTQLTRTLMQAEEAAYHAVWGASNYPCLDVGRRFTLARHPCEDDASAYVIRRVRHEATDTSHLTDNSGEPSRYDNSFEAIPYDVPFRPLRVTEKPFVHGPQTAIVVGPPGEKIFTDKHGRVRVQFHWDRYGKRDDKSSCWIRVSQAWAGRGWGAVNLPHVGHEVLVSFLEGDPDCPLVTGRVYNGENSKTMAMPDNKTQSGLKDHSGNEILMEGKGGSEDIRVHAVKDMHVTVDHDREVHVKNHLTETVDKGQEVTIKQGYKETITEGATSTISDGLKSTVNGPWESKVDGKFTETVTGGEERTVSSGQKLTVTGGSTEDVTGECKTTVTGPMNLHATDPGTYSSDANLKFSVGSGGPVIELTTSSISISIGASSITLDASGVAVAGTKISLNG